MIDPQTVAILQPDADDIGGEIFIKHEMIASRDFFISSQLIMISVIKRNVVCGMPKSDP